MVVGWALAGPLRRVPVYSLPERLLVWAALGITAFSWIGSILAALELFRWPLVCGALAVAFLGVWGYGRVVRKTAAPEGGEGGEADSSPSPARTPVWGVAAVCTVLAGAAVLYARPAESFFLVDDSAVYTIGGVLLARTGSLFAHPEVLWQTAESFVHQFMGTDPFLMNARHFGPFYQWAAAQPSVEIGFLPLSKVWTALVVWLWGPAQAAWATPFFGVMGLAMLYGLLLRLIGWPAGLAAILSLAVSLPQVWFARYPLSEAYTQVLLLAGLYLAVLARQNAAKPHLARWLAFWSALSLAGLTLLRFEAIGMLVFLGGLLMLEWRRAAAVRHAFVRPWLLTLVLASVYGLAIALGISRHYVFAQSLVTVTPRMVRVGLVVLGALGLLGVWLGVKRRSLPMLLDRASAWQPWIYIGLCGIWLALAGWQLVTLDWGASLTGWLAQYWTPLGVALGGAGLVWLLHQERRQVRRPELAALIGLGLILLIGYAIKPAVNPVHPWAVRRLVPVVLPVLALGAGTLLAAGFEPLFRLLTKRAALRSWQWMLAVGALVLFPLQLLMIGRVSWPLWGHRELAGFYRQVEAIADRLPPDAVLLFDNGQIGERLTQVFEFVFERTSLSIRATPAPQAASAIDGLITTAHSQGRQVFLAITDGDLTWNPERWQFVSRGAGRIDTTLLRPVKGRPPDATDIISRTLWLDLYEILPTGDFPLAPQLPSEFPIGAGGYPYFNEGFWNWTLDDGGRAFRWTNGEGVMELPWPATDSDQPASACLVLEVAGGRSENAPVQLTVEAEGVRLFQAQLAPGYGAQILRLPIRDLINRDSTALQVTLISGTWTPDVDKPLGVLVRESQLTNLADCAP